MANKYKNLQKQAQEERRRKKMCQEKVQFKNKEEAQASGQRIYKCPYCKKWHRSGQQAFFIAQMKKGSGFFIRKR
jgi:hypothetical protein